MKTISILLVLTLTIMHAPYARALNQKNDGAYSVFDNYMAAHSCIFDNIKGKVLSDFEDLRSFVHEQMIGRSNEEPSVEVLVSKEIQQEVTHEEKIMTNQSSEGDRLLAISCQNDGIATTATVNIYTCNGVVVTKAQYNSQNGVGCTVAKSQTKDVCYCSYEYYGDNCEALNGFTLEISKINYPGGCTGTDSFNYVYSYNGVPPCYPVNNGQTISMNNKIVPTMSDTSYSFEGVKPAFYEVVTQPDVGSNRFTYVVVGVNFKLTARSVPYNPKLQILFMNWAMMSSPKTIQTSLTLTQLAGIDTVTTSITFDSELVSLATSGRYYYELSVLANALDLTMNEGYYGGFFEQAGYKEPPGPKQLNIGLIVGLSIFGVILIVGAVVGYKLYKASKKKPEVDSGTESDPLMAYGVIDESISPETIRPQIVEKSPEK